MLHPPKYCKLTQEQCLQYHGVRALFHACYTWDTFEAYRQATIALRVAHQLENVRQAREVQKAILAPTETKLPSSHGSKSIGMEAPTPWNPTAEPWRVIYFYRTDAPGLHGWSSTVVGTYPSLQDAYRAFDATLTEKRPFISVEIDFAVSAGSWRENGRWKNVRKWKPVSHRVTPASSCLTPAKQPTR